MSSMVSIYLLMNFARLMLKEIEVTSSMVKENPLWELILTSAHDGLCSLAMDVLGKLCTLERNDEVIETGLEPEAYQSLIKVLIISDVQVIKIHVLE